MVTVQALSGGRKPFYLWNRRGTSNIPKKQKIVKNLLTVRLANNRRVDVTLSTTGEQSVRRFPFSAKDALTLLSRGGGETPKKKTATPAPPKKTKP